MIPKVIHYCWFGGNPLPDSVRKCIASWKQHCPDYRIVEWNESNYDYTKFDYTKEAYEAKKWAFVSDLARLDIIYENGGIYLDTDVELLKSLDSVLDNECFLAIEQPSHLIATGLGFGAAKGSEAVAKMLAAYDGAHFVIGKGIYDKKPCPVRNTEPFYAYGFHKEISDVTDIGMAKLYPPEYFCPYERKAQTMGITQNTLSVHHYDSTWLSETERRNAVKAREFKKNHSAFVSYFYSSFLQCENRYGKVTPVTLLKYIIFKCNTKLSKQRMGK